MAMKSTSPGRIVSIEAICDERCSLPNLGSLLNEDGSPITIRTKASPAAPPQAGDDEESADDKDPHHIYLLYTVRRCTKLLATTALRESRDIKGQNGSDDDVVKEGNSAGLVSKDSTVVIPSGYSGWFQTSDSLPLRTIEQVLMSDATQFLTCTNLAVFLQPSTSSGDHRISSSQKLRSAEVVAGSVLTIGSVFTIDENNGKNSLCCKIFNRKPKETNNTETRLLQCFDADGRHLLIPHRTNGQFYAVALKQGPTKKREDQPSAECVYRITDIVKLASMPSRIRQVFGSRTIGTEPALKIGPIFYPLFVYEEKSVIACQVGEDASSLTFIEFPSDCGVTFEITDQWEAIKVDKFFTDVLRFCRDKIDEYKIEIQPIICEWNNGHVNPVIHSSGVYAPTNTRLGDGLNVGQSDDIQIPNSTQLDTLNNQVDSNANEKSDAHRLDRSNLSVEIAEVHSPSDNNTDEKIILKSHDTVVLNRSYSVPEYHLESPSGEDSVKESGEGKVMRNRSSSVPVLDDHRDRENIATPGDTGARFSDSIQAGIKITEQSTTEMEEIETRQKQSAVLRNNKSASIESTADHDSSYNQLASSDTQPMDIYICAYSPEVERTRDISKIDNTVDIPSVHTSATSTSRSNHNSIDISSIAILPDRASYQSDDVTGIGLIPAPALFEDTMSVDGTMVDVTSLGTVEAEPNPDDAVVGREYFVSTDFTERKSFIMKKRFDMFLKASGEEPEQLDDCSSSAYDEHGYLVPLERRTSIHLGNDREKEALENSVSTGALVNAKERVKERIMIRSISADPVSTRQDREKMWINESNASRDSTLKKPDKKSVDLAAKRKSEDSVSSFDPERLQSFLEDSVAELNRNRESQINGDGSVHSEVISRDTDFRSRPRRTSEPYTGANGRYFNTELPRTREDIPQYLERIFDVEDGDEEMASSELETKSSSCQAQNGPRTYFGSPDTRFGSLTRTHDSGAHSTIFVDVPDWESRASNELSWMPSGELPSWSVEEVALALRYIGMKDHIVRRFSDERIDGRLLADLNPEILTEGFPEMNGFYRQKLVKFIQEGWRPKRTVHSYL